MANRLLKRFRREHREKGKPKQWVFHREQWGDLEVSVMPRTLDGKIVDSNTGLVLKAPFHTSLLACVVVNNGSRPNCDEAALNFTIKGDRNKYWAENGEHPYCIPRRKITAEERQNEGYQMAVKAMMDGKGYTQKQAEGLADQVLGWCPDSIQCGICQLLIPGLGARELADQAREYGWKVILFQQQAWRCPACSRPGPPGLTDIPPNDELAKLYPEDFR